MVSPAPIVNGAKFPTNSFVMPMHRIAYISTTTNASTGLRWLLANLAGEDPARFYRSAGAHQSRLTTIHGDRSAWQRVRGLHDLDAEQVAGISRDTGWLVFAVTRDPWRRLWSSWQSRLLVRQSGYVERYAHLPWFPRVPECAADVLDDWRTFVRAHPWVDDPMLHHDTYFSTQSRAIAPRRVNYSRVYDLAEIDTLLSDLRDHLARQGVHRELYFPHANESPLPLAAEVLEDGVAEAVRQLYARDFDTFPQRWSRPEAAPAAIAWTPGAIELVRWRIESNERIGDLSRELRQLRHSRTFRVLRRVRPGWPSTRPEPVASA